MKILCAMFFICGLIFNTSASAFNNANFKGSYAFQLVGPSSIVLANEPITVATGVLLADGNGHVTGHGVFRSAGATCIGTLSGGYIVQADGMGSLSSILTTSTPGCFSSVLDLAMVLSNNGATFVVSNIENDYMTGSFKQQNKTNFKLSDLNGSYALRFTGPSSVVRANEPLTVGVGVLTANGRGKLSGHGTLRSAGITCTGLYTGVYTLSNDGSGIIATNFVTNTPGCFNTVVNVGIAIFNKGNGAYLSSYDNDYMVGTLHRQLN